MFFVIFNGLPVLGRRARAIHLQKMLCCEQAFARMRFMQLLAQVRDFLVAAGPSVSAGGA